MKRLLLALYLVAQIDSFGGLPQELDFVRQAAGQLTEAQRLMIAGHCLKEGDWKEIGDHLVTSITSSSRSGDLTKPGLIDRLRLAQVLLWLDTGRHETLRQAEPGSAAGGSLAASVPAEALKAILRQTELVNSLGETVVPEDDLAGVFSVLADLIGKDPKGVAGFPALAVAYAVVYDRKPPSNWPPILYGGRDSAPLVEKAWGETWTYFMERAEKKDFVAHLRGLKAAELKFVVDAPLNPDEFRWVRKNIRLAKNDIGEAFFMVKYDKSRLKRTSSGERAAQWLHGDYTLVNIFKYGGLCGDQAYFAWAVGKAYGVPTLFFTGTGSEGGHAWVGFLEHKNKWCVDSGRYTEQRYVTGAAVNPQTWSPLTDHEVQLMTSRMMLSPKFINSSLMVTLARLLPESGSADRLQLLADAGRECPANPEVWLFKEQQLLRASDTKPLKEFYQAMVVQFKNTPDIRNYAQEHLVEVCRRAGDKTSADQIEKKMVSHNRNERVDISVAASCKMIVDKIKDGSTEDAFRLYRKSLRDFKKDAGILVSDLVVPVVLAFNEAGDADLTEKALAAACRELTPSSIGSIEDMIVAVAKKVDVSIKAQRPNQYGGRTLEVQAKSKSKAKP